MNPLAASGLVSWSSTSFHCRVGRHQVTSIQVAFLGFHAELGALSDVAPEEFAGDLRSRASASSPACVPCCPGRSQQQNSHLRNSFVAALHERFLICLTVSKPTPIMISTAVPLKAGSARFHRRRSGGTG